MSQSYYGICSQHIGRAKLVLHTKYIYIHNIYDASRGLSIGFLSNQELVLFACGAHIVEQLHTYKDGSIDLPTHLQTILTHSPSKTCGKVNNYLRTVDSYHLR